MISKGLPSSGTKAAALHTVIKTGKEVLQQNLATLLPILKAVERPPLQESLPTAVHVGVQQARKPFLQHRVNVIHNLSQQHLTYG